MSIAYSGRAVICGSSSLTIPVGGWDMGLRWVPSIERWATSSDLAVEQMDALGCGRHRGRRLGRGDDLLRGAGPCAGGDHVDVAGREVEQRLGEHAGAPAPLGVCLLALDGARPATQLVEVAAQ